MLKNLLFLCSVCCMLFSCGSFKDSIKAGSNIKKLELGMTKKQVVSIMGKSYMPVGAIQTPEGNIEVLGYPTADDNMYKLHILNDKLVQWEFERIRHPRKHHNQTN